MAPLTALSLTPAGRAWLQHTRHARILHIFDHAVNLIAGDQVLSLVTPDIGNGPFNVVLPAIDFSGHITVSDSVHSAPVALHIGDLVIDTSSASLWNPRPDWLHLRTHRARLQAHIPTIRAVLQHHAPGSSLAHLIVELPDPVSALEAQFIASARDHWYTMIQDAINRDRVACAASAAHLVGLGSGLTPAGDDWLVGCALAAHLGFPTPDAAVMLLDVIRLAASGTNPLAACWLRAAADGACSRWWHRFLTSCVQSDSREVYQTALPIVQQGHTSGADALAGYGALIAR